MFKQVLFVLTILLAGILLLHFFDNYKPAVSERVSYNGMLINIENIPSRNIYTYFKLDVSNTYITFKITKIHAEKLQDQINKNISVTGIRCNKQKYCGKAIQIIDNRGQVLINSTF